MEIMQSTMLVGKCMKLQLQEYWLKKVWQTTTLTWITITRVCIPPHDLPTPQEGNSFKVKIIFNFLVFCVFSTSLLFSFLAVDTIRNHKNSQATQIIIAILFSAHHIHYSLHQSQFHQLIHHLKWYASNNINDLLLHNIFINFDYFCSIFQVMW